MLSIPDIQSRRLKALFRYYGRFPEGCDYPAQIARCMSQLGDDCIAFAPHEQGGIMRKVTASTSDRAEAITMFGEIIRERLAEVKKLAGDRLVWITDPSVYANLYRRLGADRVGVELFALHCDLNIASVRGTAGMYLDRDWVAINSFECQAYGGLDMLEPMAELDSRYDEKRLNLWWFSQFHLYLSGARTIYSESGAFDQVVTRHLHMDDEPLVRYRRVQSELYEFSKVQPLPQPAVDIAFVKDEHDIFADKYAPAAGQAEPSDFSWLRMRTALPQLGWFNEQLRLLTAGSDDRRYYSDTPYGPADLVTLRAPLSALQKYRVLVLLGSHTLNRRSVDLLKDYAESGGQVVVTLVDFLDEHSQPTCADMLKQLCGVSLNPEVERTFLWEIETVDDEFQADFADSYRPCVYGRGAYDQLVLGGIKLNPACKVILRDKFTGEPFLVTRQQGKGRVWFINVVHHHANREYQLLANQIVRSVFDRIVKPVRLVEGRSINRFVYQYGQSDDPWWQVMVLNNDWYSTSPQHGATFVYDGIEFGIDVRRGVVEQFFLLPDLVLLTDSPLIRLDRIGTKEDNITEVDLQGVGQVDLTVIGKQPVKHAQVAGAVGDWQEVNVHGNADQSSMSVSLCGAHRLQLQVARPG